MDQLMSFFGKQLVPLRKKHAADSSFWRVIFPFTQVNKCLSIKGAEDSINKPNSFEISTMDSSQFFIADSDKVHLSN